MIHKVILNQDRKYALRSFQVIIELLRFFYLIGVENFMEGYQQIMQNIPITDNQFFYDEDIHTIADQKQKFDQANPINSDSNQNWKSNSNLNQQNPIQSEIILTKIQNRRRIYTREVLNDLSTVFDIQSKFIDYEQQIKNMNPKINQLYDFTISPQEKHRHEEAFNSIFNEQIFFQKLNDYYKSDLPNEYQNQTKNDINSLKDFIIMTSKMTLNEDIDPNKLALLGDLDGNI